MRSFSILESTTKHLIIAVRLGVKHLLGINLDQIVVMYWLSH